MLTQHVGKDRMIFPPFEPERVEELGELVPTDFDIMGAGWREVSEQPRLLICKHTRSGSKSLFFYFPFLCVCFLFRC